MTACLAREHNDANVLALGGRIVTPEAAVEMVQTFLTIVYLGGRHQRRLDKIARMESHSWAQREFRIELQSALRTEVTAYPRHA
jgi:ribose 5-phosphate isomerase RpiB